MKSLKTIQQVARDRFPMDLRGIHGIDHWKRVHENGLYLCRHTPANPTVVEAFAFLHDCCRESDGADPAHGQRAADYVETIREKFPFSADEVELLKFACSHHEKGQVSNDPTIGVCWDSDRLDLGRVAIRPNPKFLSTERAKKASTIEWAYQRSRGHNSKIKI